MKKRRMIAVLCVAAMAFSLLAGCGDSSGGEKEPAGEVDKAGEKDSKETEEPNGGETTAGGPKEELPISKEGLTLTVAIPVDAKVEDINTNQLTLYIEETTGIDLDIIELSAEDTATQINALMNGGELPDIILGYNFPYDVLCSYADAGLLQPLDEYIDTWGYNLKNTIMADPDVGENGLSYATYDGSLWAMPSGGALVTNTYASWQLRLQTAFLEELDMEFPRTLDELRTFLRAVKENYPDVIPMTSYADVNCIFQNISQAYQYTDQWNFLKVGEDGQVEFIGNNELFKEAIEYTKEMVDEGLIDPAAFTQDQSVLSSQLAQDGNNVAVLACGAFWQNLMDSSSQEFSGMRIVGALEGPHGYDSVIKSVTSIKKSMVITSACEYPEEAFRLFDFFLSDDFALKARVGFEGEQWEKAADGAIGRDGEQAWFSLLTPQEWTQPSTNVIWDSEEFIHSNIMNHCEAVVENQQYPEAQEIIAQGLKELDTNEQLPQLSMNTEDALEYSELQGLIVGSVKTAVAQFVLGTRDLAEWDAYCQELDSMGVERYVELAQKGYSALTV